METEHPSDNNAGTGFHYDLSALSEAFRSSKEMAVRLQEALSQSADYTSMMAKTFEVVNANLTPAMRNYSQIIGPVMKEMNAEAFSPALASVADRLDFGELTTPIIGSVITTQQKLWAQCAVSYQTPAISQIFESVKANDLLGTYGRIAESLTAASVKAPDFALLGQVDGLIPTLEGLGYWNDVPRGTKTFVRSLSRGARDILSRSEKVSVDLNDKKLLVEDEERDIGPQSHEDAGCEIRVGATTFNILASPLSVFDDLTEADMMKLQQMCFDMQAYARECKAGRVISEAIEDWKDLITFDHDCYYHARLKPAGEAPFLPDDMEKAPRQYVRCGRFNPPEKAYYYFSDTEHGAICEVGRHGDGQEVQVARLVGKDGVRLIDFSGVGRECNYFLKYIRFPFASPDSIVPVEYLVPNFVAQCCRHAGIDGIKYYGSKEYSNYVVWDDHRLRMLDTYVVR